MTFFFFFFCYGIQESIHWSSACFTFHWLHFANPLHLFVDSDCDLHACRMCGTYRFLDLWLLSHARLLKTCQLTWNVKNPSAIVICKAGRKQRKKLIVLSVCRERQGWNPACLFSKSHLNPYDLNRILFYLIRPANTETSDRESTRFNPRGWTLLSR